MTIKVAFLGQFVEISPFAKETIKYFNDMKNDFKPIKKADFEIIGSTSKFQILVFDLEQIEILEEKIKEFDIIVLYLSFSNSDSFDFINEEWVSNLKNLISDNQCRFLVGNTTNDFNTNNFSQNILDTMNILNFDKYFERKSGQFLQKEEEVGSLTILPNFYSYLSDQIKKLASIPINTQPNENIQISNGPINYTLFPNTNTAKVIHSPNATGNVLIQTIVNHDSKSYTVTEIDNNAFRNVKIESLSFEPNSQVKIIGKYAFQNSTIKTLSIPDSLEEFCEDWCNGVEHLKEVEINDKHLHFQYKDGLLINKKNKEIIFAKRDLTVVKITPEDKKKIGPSSSYSCNQINPEDIKKIGPSSFYSCNQITTILIKAPDIENIGAFAFCQCNQLRNFEISGAKKVTLGESCLSYSKSLQNFIVSCDELILGNNCFQCCSSLLSLSFPVKKISIGRMAMIGCDKLSAISIPNAQSIEIKNCSFLSLNKLESLFLHTENFSVCDDSFENCTSINNVYLNSKEDVNSNILKDFSLLKRVDLTSFSTLALTKSSIENAHNLETIRLRSPVLGIEKGSFKNHKKLASIRIECENTISLSSSDFDGCKALKSFKYIKSEYLKQSDKIDLSENCFVRAENLEEVEITATNINLGKSCFSGLKKLQKVILKGENIIINDNCFNGCVSIKEFIVKDCTNRIELAENCFNNAINLEVVDIKAKKISIGYKCFFGSTKLQSVVLNGNSITISDHCFNNCNALKSFSIVYLRKTKIGSKQFTKCSNLKTISFSVSQSNSTHFEKENLVLAKDCFDGVYYLDSIEFNGGNVFLTKEHFNYCSTSSLSIKAANNIEFDSGMFNNSKELTDIFLSGISLKINENCFNNNSKLKSVAFFCFDIEIQKNCFNDIKNCNSLQFNNAIYMNLDSDDFCRWKNLTEIQLSSLTYLIVGQNCFTKSDKLKHVSFHSKEVTIGSCAFQKCSSLESVKFIQSTHSTPIFMRNVAASYTPNSDKNENVFIGDEAFNSCYNLNELNIEAANELFIGKKCFNNFTKLNNVKINSTRSKIDESSFFKCPGLPKLPSIPKPTKKLSIDNFDIQSSFESKRSNNIGAADLSFKNDRKFDSFYVLGVDRYTQKPSFISMFPARPCTFKDNETVTIIEFCYPQGKTKIPSELPNDSNVLNGFVFYFANKSYIGCVLHIYIPETSNSFVGNQFDRSYPFSLCLISNNPDISSHFQFLYDMIDPIVGKTVLPQEEVRIPEVLQNQQGNCTKFLHLKPSCQYIALSSSAHSMEFLLPKLIKYYTDKTPLTLDQTDCLLYPTLQVLLSYISPREIVEVFLCMLCEFKIFFVSKDVNKASFCVIALTNLMKEMDIHSILIPCLPSFIDSYTESPLPTIIGYHRASSDAEVFVNLDENQIKYQKDKIAIVRNFPYSATLIKKVTNLFQSKVNQFIIPEKTDLSEYSDFLQKANKTIYPECFQYFVKTKYILTQDFIRDFSLLFTRPFVPSLKFFTKSFMITDSSDVDNPVTIFNKSMFLYHIQDKYKEFMVNFSNTMTFSQFQIKVEEEAEKSQNRREIINRNMQNQFNQNKSHISLVIKNSVKVKRRNSCTPNNKKLRALD